MVSNRSLSAVTDLQSVYTSSYKQISYSPAHGLLYQEWSPESLHLTLDMFKEEATAYVQMLLEYKPRLLLLNQEDFNFRITDEHNSWYLKYMAPALQTVKPRRAAVVANEDLLNHIQMEQLAEAMQNYFISFQIEYLFFENNTKAFEWLIAP